MGDSACSAVHTDHNDEPCLERRDDVARQAGAESRRGDHGEKHLATGHVTKAADLLGDVLDGNRSREDQQKDGVEALRPAERAEREEHDREGDRVEDKASAAHVASADDDAAVAFVREMVRERDLPEA